MERAQALRVCIGVGASRFDVLCVDIFFFGFFGISVPLHIVVRINSIEILFFFLVLLSRVFFPLLRSEEEGKISIFFDNKNCFSLQSLTRKINGERLSESGAQERENIPKTRSVECWMIRPWVVITKHRTALITDSPIMWRVASREHSLWTQRKNTFSSPPSSSLNLYFHKSTRKLAERRTKWNTFLCFP